MDPLSLGRSLYGKKDYQGALEAFTEAVNISTGIILLTALDHRAATYEKLDRLQLALRDAREMMELKPGNSKGYLRCAKILLLKGEESLAVKIYERGLKKVKTGGDTDRALLRKMLSKLQQKQLSSKRQDPVLKLPPELMQLIFKELCSRDHAVCLCVSKAWKHLLEGFHEIWATLDMRRCKAAPSLSSIMAHCRRSNFTLTRIIAISPYRSLDDSKRGYIQSTCKMLQHLEFYGYGIIYDSLLSFVQRTSNIRTIIIGKNIKIPAPTVYSALRCCPQIVHAEFRHIDGFLGTKAGWSQMDSLEILNLTCGGNSISLTVLDLPNLVKCAPNIRSASFVSWGVEEDRFFGGFGECKKLERLDLSNTRFKGFPTIPKTLKYLNVSANPGLCHAEGVDLHRLEWPSLGTLICGRNGDGSSKLLAHLLGAAISAGTLKRLEIFYLPDLLALFPSTDFSMSCLKDLRITDCQEPEDVLLSLLRRCTSLRRLALESTKVTGVSVKEVMTKDSGPLEYLSLIDCTAVSSDAITWARSKGTVVECQASDIPEKRHFFNGL